MRLRDRAKPFLASQGLLEPALATYRTLRSINARNAKNAARNLAYRLRGAPDGLPLPPSDLMVLVSGVTNYPWFYEGAAQEVGDITRILRKHDVVLPGGLGSLLDFGCGCGRMSRHFRQWGCDIHGADINSEQIEWCQENLPFGTFDVNDLRPPLKYPASSFDFVYCGSVFTHLPVSMQDDWLLELKRILQPGGYLCMTTNGESQIYRLSPAQKEQYYTGQVIAVTEAAAGKNACLAFHSLAAMQRYEQTGLFAVVEFAPLAAAAHSGQDLFLLQKIATPTEVDRTTG